MVIISGYESYVSRFDNNDSVHWLGEIDAGKTPLLLVTDRDPWTIALPDLRSRLGRILQFLGGCDLHTGAQHILALKGLLFGHDGRAMSPSHTRRKGKLYRYYVSQTVLKHGAGSCPVGRVPADEIEAAVRATVLRNAA